MTNHTLWTADPRVPATTANIAQEVTDLFAKAFADYEASGYADDWYFPYDIEAELDELDVSYDAAWNAYFAAREANRLQVAA